MIRHLLILMLRALVVVCCTGLPESVTRAVKLKVPLVVGVPEMRPVPLLSVNPGGSEPLAIDHAYGLVPPVAASVREYWLPTLPFGSDVVVMLRVWAAAIVMLNCLVAICAALSVTRTVKVNIPAAVGVPEIAPVDEFSESPLGREPLTIDQL
jgi:hypothetical protein